MGEDYSKRKRTAWKETELSMMRKNSTSLGQLVPMVYSALFFNHCTTFVVCIHICVFCMSRSVCVCVCVFILHEQVCMQAAVVWMRNVPGIWTLFPCWWCYLGSFGWQNLSGRSTSQGSGFQSHFQFILSAMCRQLRNSILPPPCLPAAMPHCHDGLLSLWTDKTK